MSRQMLVENVPPAAEGIGARTAPAGAADARAEAAKGADAVAEMRDDILHQCVANNRSFRHDASAAQAPAGLMPAELLDFCQSGDLLLAPVLVGTRCIGVLYADRTLSGAAISQEDFDAFAELAHQLALSIELVGKPAS